MTQSSFAVRIGRFAFCSALVGATLLFSPAMNAQTTVDGIQPDAALQSGSGPLISQQIEELQKVTDRWDDAVNQHDQYALELVLAPQFVSVSDTGKVEDRDEVVSQMVTKDAPHFTLAQKVASVRIVGDVAVVNGTYDRSYQGSRLGHTKAKDEKGVFSQVYVRARNSWECINAQHTLIEGATTAGKKKTREEASDKHLNHDLGFHLPGLHHSDADAPQQ